MIVQPGAVFPEVCIGCGKLSWGNTIHGEFSGFGWLLAPLPVLDALAHFIFDERYHFDFPFCSSCSPDRLQLIEVRLDNVLAIFVARKDGFPGTFVDSLPPVPVEVAAEANRTWLQRTFRWLCGRRKHTNPMPKAHASLRPARQRGRHAQGDDLVRLHIDGE